MSCGALGTCIDIYIVVFGHEMHCVKCNNCVHEVDLSLINIHAESDLPEGGEMAS